MKSQRAIVFYLVLLVLSALPASAGTLDTLKPDHPRILAHADDFDRIAELVKTDPLAKGWYDAMKERAQGLLDEPVAKYELRDGRRLLYVSREVLARVKTLGLLHRIEPDERYVERIWADMQAAANFDHWHPDHFLDVAEMGFAFALAYDWLYDDWTEVQRQTMRDAMVRHAIKPGLKAHDQDVWWTRTKINWNQVCHGGLICAALAVAEHEPELAEQMLERSIKALPISMRRYAPDGGYDEGPGYWAFGTIYNVFAIAALESALGRDFGLGDLPGFATTGNFPQHMTGATGRQYNFGDNKERPVSSSALFYLAKRFDQPSNAYHAAQRANGNAFDLLWYDPRIFAQDDQTLPLNVVYPSAGIGVLRSAWGDPQAWYVGLKGGAVDHGHAQMDLGSFILESQGVRWFVDLGSDNYNLPGYFHSGKGGDRWDYYRNRAEGHNTLVVNPRKTAGQRFDTFAPITLDNNTLAIDLSEIYNANATRTIELDTKQNVVLLTDEIQLDAPGDIWWFAHTRAKITLSADKRIATLERDGKAMRVSIVTPGRASFQIMDARPLPTSPNPAGQNPNTGATLANTVKGGSHTKRGDVPIFGEPDPEQAVRKLAIHLEEQTDARIKVVFEPVSDLERGSGR